MGCDTLSLQVRLLAAHACNESRCTATQLEDEMKEMLFSVQLVVAPNQWGDDMTAQLLNPDGSVVEQFVIACGPDGFSGADETAVADFVADAAREFMEVYFTSEAEKSQRI